MYKTGGSAGMDVRAAIDATIRVEPGAIALVRCGFAIAVPNGYEAQLRPRSGLASKSGITLVNSPGTIDSDYRGEVQAAVINLGREPFEITRGLRIAQLVVGPVSRIEWNEVAELQLPATAVASVTREPCDRRQQSEFADVLRGLILRYQRSCKPVSVNFRRIVPGLTSSDRFTHLVHPYPAKLLVHIPYFFLASDLLSKPGDVVLDPFCGSGTVLFEAQLANRRAYGVDANPLARLISRVKTTPLEVVAVKQCLDRVLSTIQSEPLGPPPDVVNVEQEVCGADLPGDDLPGDDPLFGKLRGLRFSLRPR